MLVLLSGGIDSSTLLWHLKAEGHQCQALGIYYGQRHARELQAAAKIADVAGVKYRSLTMFLNDYIKGHPLFSDVNPLPEGADQSATVIPGRNLFLLSTGAIVASSLGLDALAIGCQAGDRETYADCRQAFINRVWEAFDSGMPEHVGLWAPFVSWTKAQVVARARELGVPLQLTWSCYAGGVAPCGKCGACRAREDAGA